MGRMRILGLGELAPTLHRFTGRCPPRGRIFAWGGPARNRCPHAPPLRGSLPPEGAHFALGRPGGETVAPTFHRFTVSRVAAPQWGRLSSWRGLAVKPLPSRLPTMRQRGFTLLELLLVLAIVAIVSGGVSLALRDSEQSALERDGQRLAALLESARARSQASGVPVRWRTTPNGFVFDGLAADSLPRNWLSAQILVSEARLVLLGPEPIIAPQQIRLVARNQPSRSLTVMTDGVRPFSVQNTPAQAP